MSDPARAASPCQQNLTELQAAALACTQLWERKSFASWVKTNTLEPAGAGTVSFVVPVLNESATLPDLFQHFASLDPPPHEIIFVDGQSTDGCASLGTL